MEKSTLYGLAIFLVIIGAGFFFLKPDNTTVTANVIEGAVAEGEMQRVVLSQEGLNYKDVTVEADKPIAISADNSVSGCLRSAVFNIGGKKYSKYLKTPDDTLELPALTKGTYQFSCSMGMGLGKLIAQ